MFRHGQWPAALALLGILSSPDIAAAAGQTGEAQPSTPAANRDLARSVAVTGREAFNTGDYPTALTLFRRAYSLYPAPTVGLYEARTLSKLGLLIEAVQAYARTAQIPMQADAPAQFAEAIAAARLEGNLLSARIPSLILTVNGASADHPDLQVTIDGQGLAPAQLGQPRKLNPGVYQVSASVSPERQARTEAVLEEGHQLSVVLDLKAGAAEAIQKSGAEAAEQNWSAHTRNVPAVIYVAGAVAVTGISTGLVTGALANRKHSEAEARCPGRQCVEGSQGSAAVDAFRSLRTLSTVSYGIGAAGLAAGIVLLLTTSDDNPHSEVGSVEPWLTPHRAGLQGRF
jgi:hypothetical protein